MYKIGLDSDLIEKYNRYMDRSLMMDTNTYDTLNINPDVYKKRKKD